VIRCSASLLDWFSFDRNGRSLESEIVTCNIPANGTVTIHSPLCYVKAIIKVNDSLSIQGRGNTTTHTTIVKHTTFHGTIFSISKGNSLQLNNFHLIGKYSNNNNNNNNNNRDNLLIEGNGGSIVVEGLNARLVLINCIIADHFAIGLPPYGYGGAIFVHDFAVAYMENVTFKTNYAENEGGAIYGKKNSIIHINNSHFVENVAGFSGGSIAVVDNVDIDVINSYIRNSSANYQGGGVFISNSARLSKPVNHGKIVRLGRILL
tara:strand:+ start:869 stop:1657 length:789 start_codon:yes stop_codon:yes gene_type:complete